MLIETVTSYERCVGIAAPQIGELVRVAIVDVSEHPKAETSNGLLVLANPRVVGSEGSSVAREGCLSLPDVTANVRRATRIEVEHLGGKVVCEGFEARAVLHEIDHLDGVLFLDRSSRWSTTSFAGRAMRAGPARMRYRARPRLARLRPRGRRVGRARSAGPARARTARRTGGWGSTHPQVPPPGKDDRPRPRTRSRTGAASAISASKRSRVRTCWGLGLATRQT